MQLNVVRQRHPSASLSISRRSAALVAAVEDEAVGVDDRRRAEVAAPSFQNTGQLVVVQQAHRMHLVVSSSAGPVVRALDAFPVGWLPLVIRWA